MEDSKERSDACHQQPRMSTCSVVCKGVRVTKKDATHTGMGGKSALLREATEQNRLQSLASVPRGPRKTPFLPCPVEIQQ